MKRRSLSVIIPSRTQPRQTEFLERAAASIRAQSAIQNFDVTILVGVDAGKDPGINIARRLGLKFVESDGNSQAAALNAGIRQANTDFVAFLEDDDQWLPQFLEFATWAISQGDFVSSTQLDCDDSGEVLRINDFPTPSGWFMPRTTLEAIGEFNEEYRFHLDNEWLGRLSESKLARWHLVESTAPINPRYLTETRPRLANLVAELAGNSRFARHRSPYPLVRRLRHPGAGVEQIHKNSSFKEISSREMAQLVARFGGIPW